MNFYYDRMHGEITVDFSFRYRERKKDILYRATFCDGDAEWILEGNKAVKRSGNMVQIVDVKVECPSNRTKLHKDESRELWHFLQFNGFRALV